MADASSGDWWLNTFQGAVQASVSLLPPATFAQMPSPVGLAGTRGFITDSFDTAFGAAVSTGGSVNKVPVYSDGTNWLVG
jgi:hypothetical protein